MTGSSATRRTSPAPLLPDALAAVLAPFGSSTTLPGEAYTSPEVFEWERVNLWEGSWVCLGRAADLEAPGDRKAVRTGTESILVVRGDDGEPRTFFNVCRHRGHELQECGTGGAGRVVKCPYHGWVYSVSGELKAAPRLMKDAFDPADFGLIEARSVEWHGWVFVNATGNAPSFEEHTGSLGEFVAPYEPGRLKTGARRDYEVEANWKLLIENYHECYHCPSIHPELCRVTPPDSGSSLEPDGMWVAGDMELMGHAETMSFTGESRGVRLRGVTDERRVLYIDLFPNLLISPHPDYVMTHRLEPLGPARTRVECEWLFPPEAFDREDFDPAYAADFWDLTNAQDWRACESVQRGVRSRAFKPGPLAAEELSLYRFITMVARAYVGGPGA